MQHLRDEEAERRRVLESLRKEAREKAQMEHRLKKRETELARLETRLVDEEKRLEALKGSQAVSEEEGLKRGDALKTREEEIHRLEKETQERLLMLKREEETLKQNINERRYELRDREKVEAALKKKEELFAATEGRLRSKEDELTRQLVELERTKVQLSEREKDASTKETVTPSEASKAMAPERVTVPPRDERALRRDDILELLSKRVRKTEK
jgi:DNA repair exonuclease SbcCD ATPase subunit